MVVLFLPLELLILIFLLKYRYHYYRGVRIAGLRDSVFVFQGSGLKTLKPKHCIIT